MRSKSDPDRSDKLIAKLMRGPRLTQVDLGDPISGATSYALCFYDGRGRFIENERIVAAAEAGGALCGGTPCWRSIGRPPPDGRGYRYSFRDGNAAGITKVIYKGGDTGRSKVIVKVDGDLAQTDLAEWLGQGPPLLTMQFRASDGICLSATMDDLQPRANGRFKASGSLPGPPPSPYPTDIPGTPTNSPTATFTPTPTATPIRCDVDGDCPSGLSCLGRTCRGAGTHTPTPSHQHLGLWSFRCVREGSTAPELAGKLTGNFRSFSRNAVARLVFESGDAAIDSWLYPGPTPAADPLAFSEPPAENDVGYGGLFFAPRDADADSCTGAQTEYVTTLTAPPVGEPVAYHDPLDVRMVRYNHQSGDCRSLQAGIGHCNYKLPYQNDCNQADLYAMVQRLDACIDGPPDSFVWQDAENAVMRCDSGPREGKICKKHDECQTCAGGPRDGWPCVTINCCGAHAEGTSCESACLYEEDGEPGDNGAPGGQDFEAPLYADLENNCEATGTICDDSALGPRCVSDHETSAGPANAQVSDLCVRFNNIVHKGFHDQVLVPLLQHRVRCNGGANDGLPCSDKGPGFCGDGECEADDPDFDNECLAEVIDRILDSHNQIVGQAGFDGSDASKNSLFSCDHSIAGVGAKCGGAVLRPESASEDPDYHNCIGDPGAVSCRQWDAMCDIFRHIVQPFRIATRPTSPGAPQHCWELTGADGADPDDEIPAYPDAEWVTW